MSTCCVEFEYTYTWDQILAEPDVSEQLVMLEANMTALEDAITNSGSCAFEFPFRWYNFWEALLAGEPWAIGIAEENDRAIEFRFGRCSCTEGGIITTSSDHVAVLANSDVHTFTVDDTLHIWHVEGTDFHVDGFVFQLRIDNIASRTVELFLPTGGDLDCDINLSTLAITGTFPGDTSVSAGFLFTPNVTAGQAIRFQSPQITVEDVGTPNAWSMSVTTDNTTVDLPWNNHS